jgi:hypothetical protein
VKARLTAWLSLLLLVSAVFGLPVTRGNSSRVVVEIVFEQRERYVDALVPPPLAVRNPAPERAAVDAPPALLLEHSLFQRPPPAV